VETGGSWCIPDGAEHSVDAPGDSVVIEVFSPVRENYLPCSRSYAAVLSPEEIRSAT